jgi:zinc protease
LSIEIRTVGENLPAVIAHIKQVLQAPSLLDGVLKEERERWLGDLERSMRDPTVRLEEMLGRHGNPYPLGDIRYVATIEEEAAAIKLVTLPQLQDFHRQFVTQGVGNFAAVGDFNLAATRLALGNLMAASSSPRMQVGRAAEQRPPAPPSTLQWRTPGIKNANVVLALQLPLRDIDEDALALQLANRIFGQIGSGRLWLRLREREGTSYGAWASTNWNAYDAISWWRTTVTFAPNDRQKVEAALREELTNSLQSGFSATELAAAKKGLLNERRLTLAQDATVARKLIENAALGRNFAAQQQQDDKLAGLSLEQVNAAWRKYIDPARLVWAWTGDWE